MIAGFRPEFEGDGRDSSTREFEACRQRSTPAVRNALFHREGWEHAVRPTAAGQFLSLLLFAFASCLIFLQ